MQEKPKIAFAGSVDDGHGDKEGIKDISEDFLSNSTLHGVNKLSPSGISLYRRGLWLCFILGSAGYMTYTVIEELRNYYTYPTTTNIRLEQENELSVPSVTICNLSPYKKSAQPTDDERFHNFWLMLTDTWRWAHKPINWSDPYYQSALYQDPVTIEYIHNTSFRVDEVFYSCKLDAIPVHCSQIMERIMTDVGPCFVFNKDGKMTTRRTGANFNFLIAFNVHQDEYFYGFTDGSGIKFAIHEPGQSANMFSEGFVVPPGTIAYAAVNRRIYSYLPYPYTAFRDRYCVDTESKSFRNPLKVSNYSSYSCISECLVNIALTKTGCMAPSNFGMGPFCSYANYSKYFTELATAYLDANTLAQCAGNCTPPCKSVEYDTKLSYAEYPSQFTSKLAADLVPDSNNFTYEYYRRNILTLNVDFEKLTTTYMETVPVYTSVGDVLAKVGGQMGLFLGASLLTLTELFEFCCRLIYQVLRKKNKLDPKPVLR